MVSQNDGPAEIAGTISSEQGDVLEIGSGLCEENTTTTTVCRILAKRNVFHCQLVQHNFVFGRFIVFFH